jgi:hypothetical protein
LQIAALQPPTRNFAQKAQYVFRDTNKQQCKIKLGGAALRFTVIIDLLSLYVRRAAHPNADLLFKRYAYERETLRNVNRIPHACRHNAAGEIHSHARALGEVYSFLLFRRYQGSPAA